MESGHVGAARVLVPVPDSSDVFQSRILAPLQSAYLYEESKQSFKYKSAVLIKNEPLEEKYNAFRARRSEAGYSEEDLKETFGFLLFDDVNQAHSFGETGLLTGKSACTTLGDPFKGVYISMYSDCLDLNRWYQGKSGYVAIIRLTKGRVKRVPENYTQNFTAPTAGFDCHESGELSSVSSKTSSFLAFERTQYYLYELLDEESSETALSPSAAVPFAIVSFSYTDTKAILVTSQATSEKKRLVCDYMAWRGQLQIGTQSYEVGLRSTKGALIPTKLPPVVKVERAISMLDLMQLLPKPAFENCFSAEVFLGGLYCSLYELVPSEAKDTNSLSQLLQEIKEKDLALTVSLKDGGFLILLHSSHFPPIDDDALNASEVLQGMFIFPGSRVVKRGSSGQKKATISSEILQVLPVLSYAEGVVEKTPLNSTEDLCDVLRQHMQSYAELIHPGLDLTPSREVSLFPDQYDVLDDHRHLYSSPEWTDKARQSFRSYMSKPVSFQLPVSMASEILAAEEGEQGEDLEDNIYCLSSPEEAPTNPIGMGSEDQLTDQKSPVNAETSVENSLISTGAQVDFITGPQTVVPKDLQADDAAEDNSKSDLTTLSKTFDTGAKTPLSSPTSDDMSAELIVSITSAEQTVTDEGLNVISSMTAAKNDDFQMSGFSAAKLQTAGVNSLHKTVKIKTIDCPEVTNSSETKRRKVRMGRSKVWLRLKKTCVETESSGDSQLNNLWNIDRRKLSRKCNFGKLLSKNKKVRWVTDGLSVAEERETGPAQQRPEDTSLMGLELCPQRRKTLRWELKPVISECGRILVPHGAVAVPEQIQSLKHKFQCTLDEQCAEKKLVDASVNDHKKVEMEQESNTVPLTAVDKTDDIISTEGKNLFDNIGASFKNENSLFRQSDNCSLPLHPVSSEHSSRNDGTDTPPTEVKETGPLLTGKCAKKGEFDLSKLKSVLLMARRKNNVLVSKETTTGIAHAEPRLKEGKDDAEALEALTSVQDTNVDVKEVTNMQSVDPRFAYALGLTPKENPDKVQKSEVQVSQFKDDSSDTQEQALSNKRSQVLQSPPSIFTRRGRIKMLKKHQGISEDNIKKNWWLHFQTPTRLPTDKLKPKEDLRDNSVKKTDVEKLNNACSSTEALNLLADLALSASIDKVLPQPALEGKPETSFKKCGLRKDVPSAGQESLLHSLLRKPAAKFIQPLETSSSSPPVEDRELVGLISKEHGYSLPSSFSLLLGLPGTTFRVTPLNGSTRLLHHQQHLSRDHTVRPTFGQEDRHERNHYGTSEYQKKCLERRETFRHSRTIVNKDKSVTVTRQWKENYDFSRDSKFASVSKGRAVVRALHGPWDSSVQDISDELRLIVHMWIGLFYSRSTARSFQDESSFTNLCSEESDSLDMSCEMVSQPAQSENRANSVGAFPSPTDSQDPSTSKVLDLSQNDNFVFDQGSVILDLSLRNSRAETVTLDPQINCEKSSELKEASDILNTLKTSVGLQEARTLQCYKPMVHVTETINEVNDLRRNYGNEETSSPSQKADCLDCIDKPSFGDDRSFTHGREEIKSVSIWTGNLQTPFLIGFLLHESNKEKRRENNNIAHSQTTGIGLVPKQAKDSPKSMTNDEAESDKEDVLCIDEDYEILPKDGEKLEVNGNPCQEKDVQPSPKRIHKWDDSTKQQLDIGCNGYCFENEKQLSREGPKPVSPGQTANVAEEDNCGKEDELDCVSKDIDLSDQSLPMKCDGLESVQDCFTDCSRQAQFDEQPPQACHDAQLRKPCANDSALTDEHAISEEAPCTPHENEPFCDESADEENSVKYTCLAEEAPCQKAVLLIPDESTCSLNGSSAAGFIPHTKDSLEMRGSDDPDDQKTRSVVLERKDNNASQEESFHHQSHSPPSEVIKKDEAEEASTKETNLKMNISNEDLKQSHSEVIPFIGSDIVQLHISHPQGKMDVQGQKGIPLNSETAQLDKPTAVSSSSIMYRKEEEVNVGKISLLDVSETNQPLVFGSEADNRCHTPTLDEVPCECIPCSLPGGSTEKTCINITSRCLRRSSTPLNLEKPLEQKLCYPSRVHSDPSPHYVQHSDEQRTLNVLKCLETFLSISKRTNRSTQIETPDAKNRLDQKPNLSSKHLSTSSADMMNKKLGNLKPVLLSTSTSQELPKESSGHLVLFKNKLEEVLGVQLQQQNKDSPLPQHSFERTDITTDTSIGKDYCHPYRSTPSVQCLQTIEPNIDQDGHKTTSESNLNDGPGSYNQRPVMAVKPSKNDGSQSDHSSTDGKIEYSPTYAPPTTMALEKTECFIEIAGLKDENPKFGEFSTKSYQLSIVNVCKSDEATFAHLDPPDKCQIGSMILSSALSKQSVELSKSDQHQGFFTHSLPEKVGETIKENPKVDQKDGSGASTLFGDDYDTNITDENLIPGPNTSLMCTVFNTCRKRPYSFLEEISRRCLEDDPTQVSMEQECLIFSDQMKLLLKRSKRGQISEQDTDDTLTLSCPSPLTVHFSSLEEQEDSLDLLDAPSIAGQKIKVDMSDRKNAEDEKTMHPQNLSPKTDNIKEHADVSVVTANSAILYEAIMDGICGAQKAPLRPEHSMNKGYKNIEPSNPFDFCDQMKREMDESFRSKLNSVVKKSCKTKYRFYILATSDDAVFEETKAQLESVGHTSIQPSKFFLGEGSSSSLLIILRNEDIAEHICKVPHLLELKKSPGVQFAGIDEPDDVVNLTHQELFTRGGFLMFDNAAMESLSLCDMKKCSDILQELGRTGKWKWMLHYRDSRRLKENARLNSEAKEKKCFLNSCQDSGILEFLPYHKCDHTSRDQPDYLTCLVRLQVQNISARYPLFITDATTDGAFGRNGILTMTVNSFLTRSPSETLL